MKKMAKDKNIFDTQISPKTDLEGIIEDLMNEEKNDRLRPSKIKQDLQTYDLLKNETYERLEIYEEALK
jgi:hypothetical protein